MTRLPCLCGEEFCCNDELLALVMQADHIEDLNASLEEARHYNLEDVAVYEAGMEIQVSFLVS